MTVQSVMLVLPWFSSDRDVLLEYAHACVCVRNILDTKQNLIKVKKGVDKA